MWQPLQKNHKYGPYSDMQKVEKMMAEEVGIPVHAFEFIDTEVFTDSEMEKFKSESASRPPLTPDEVERLFAKLDLDGNGSIDLREFGQAWLESSGDLASLVPEMQSNNEVLRSKPTFLQRLGIFLIEKGIV